MIFSGKTREFNIQHCPSWAGISSAKSHIAAQHCPCCNHSMQDSNLDQQLDVLYSSDEFRMYRCKVQRCPSSRTSHDWTDCPFLHPGEKARRRDPRKFLYSGNICANFRKNGKCPKHDECQFAHGVFEMWLHPDKYRTKLCRDGLACKRKVCFFAHSAGQLRWPSSDCDLSSESEVSSVPASPSNSAHLPMLSSLLSAILADMQLASSNEIGKSRSFCTVDMLRDRVIEVPDVNWVSDLVDF